MEVPAVKFHVKLMLQGRHGVRQERLAPEQVGIRVDLPIARWIDVSEPVNVVFHAILAVVPHGKFQSQGRKQCRLLAAPAQAGADRNGAPVLRQFEIIRRVVIPFVKRIMKGGAHHAVERHPGAVVEQVINAGGQFRSMAGEGLFRQIFSLIDFIIGIRKAATRQPDADVRMRSQRIPDPQFRIEINRRDGRPQREIGAQEIRLIVIIKRVLRGERRVALRGAAL